MVYRLQKFRLYEFGYPSVHGYICISLSWIIGKTPTPTLRDSPTSSCKEEQNPTIGWMRITPSLSPIEDFPNENLLFQREWGRSLLQKIRDSHWLERPRTKVPNGAGLRAWLGLSHNFLGFHYQRNGSVIIHNAASDNAYPPMEEGGRDWIDHGNGGLVKYSISKPHVSKNWSSREPGHDRGIILRLIHRAGKSIRNPTKQ